MTNGLDDSIMVTFSFLYRVTEIPGLQGLATDQPQM